MFRRSGQANVLCHIIFNHVIENVTHNSSNVWLMPDLGQHVLFRPSPIKRGAYRRHICASQYGIQVEDRELWMDKNIEHSTTLWTLTLAHIVGEHCGLLKFLFFYKLKIFCVNVCVEKREKAAGWFADFRLPYTYKSSNGQNSLRETTLKPASEKWRAAIVIL